MKISKAIVTSCLIGVVILSIGYECSRAELKADELSTKIGVVSIRKILQGCNRAVRYKQEATNENIRVNAELAKLNKDIGDETDSLKALKPGSSDYMEQLKQILEKQARLKVQQEFYDRQRTLREQRMMEQLYEDIMQIAGQIAEKKDLVLVIRKDELLYSGGCMDITDEVMTQVDAKESEKLKMENVKP